MKMLVCPSCGARSFRAYFQSDFSCGHCGIRLMSDIKVVSFVESLILTIPSYLCAWTIADLFQDREFAMTYAALALLLPATAVHWLVVSHFVKLKMPPPQTSNEI